MVSTRSKGTAAEVGEKRSAPAKSGGGTAKKAKKEDRKLEVGEDGQVGLKEEPSADKEDSSPGQEESSDGKEKLKGKTNDQKPEDHKADKEDSKPKAGEDMNQTREEMKEEEGKKAETGEDEVDKTALSEAKEELEEPKHGEPHAQDVGYPRLIGLGTLESGHIYFLYRPKIDHGDDVGSIDDISKYVQ
jgi:hypothetical protein